MVAMAAVSAVGSIASANSARSQNKNQKLWSKYNAQMGYNVTMSNLDSQAMLGAFNARMAAQAGAIQAGILKTTAAYNATQITHTVEYNNALLEEEERLMWEAQDLDQVNLARQRERERGGMRATQAASGTTIDVGSNKDVIADQLAQQNQDAFVLRHNADIGAAKIANAQAQNSWQGAMQVQKTIWEGQMGAYGAEANAQMQAASIQAETLMSAHAGAQSARYALDSGMAGANMQYGQNNMKISQSLTQGLFSAGSKAVGAYYGGMSTGSDSLMSGGSTAMVDHYGR